MGSDGFYRDEIWYADNARNRCSGTDEIEVARGGPGKLTYQCSQPIVRYAVTAGRLGYFASPIPRPCYRAYARRLSTLVPSWSRKTRFGGRDSVGPDYDLFTVLPLCRHSPAAGLITALVDGEGAKERRSLERQQRLPQLVGIQTSGSFYGVHKKLTPRVPGRRLHRGSMIELFLVGCDKLLIARIGKGGVPERSAVNELGVLTELSVVVGKQPIRNCAEHRNVYVKLLHLACDSEKVLEPDRARHQNIGFRCPRFVQKIGEVLGTG